MLWQRFVDGERPHDPPFNISGVLISSCPMAAKQERICGHLI
jgi:hypothetical protein